MPPQPALPRPSNALTPLLLLLCAILVLGLTGCASLLQREAVRINVVGLEPIAGAGMEMRFMVKLRVQNPNEAAIEFDGLALDLDLNGRPFATGVSDQQGSVPRFGEAVIDIPVSVSAVALVRQALGVIEGDSKAEVPYAVRGRLAGGLLGGMRFADSGTLKLPEPLKTPR